MSTTYEARLSICRGAADDEATATRSLFFTRIYPGLWVASLSARAAAARPSQQTVAEGFGLAHGHFLAQSYCCY